MTNRIEPSSPPSVSGGRFVLQLLRIVIGFILALTAAGLFLAWGFFQSGGPEADPVGFAATIGTGFVAASVIGGMAFLPAVLAIGLAEALRIRSPIYHVGLAGLIGLGAWLLDSALPQAGVRPGTTIALAASFVAGGVYWIIAGRCSGHWRR